MTKPEITIETNNDLYGKFLNLEVTDNGIGIAGVSWDTSIGSMKVCWEDTSLAILGIVLAYCDDADIAEAIDYAANSGLYQVINMSLAGPEFSITLQNAIDQAWDAGLVIVAGAGNEYTDTIMYPAGYANVIAVGSSDQHDNLSYFSSFGSWVSVLAPGSAIFSTIPGEFCGQPSTESSDCYDWKSGTSMSAPHVAGLAALLWAHKTGATNADIRNAIQNAATPVGVLGQNFQAWSQYGRIDMGSALSVSITELEPTAHHVDALTASTINIGRGSKQGQIQVRIRDVVDGPLDAVVELVGHPEVDTQRAVHGKAPGDRDIDVSQVTVIEYAARHAEADLDVTKRVGREHTAGHEQGKSRNQSFHC